MLANPFGDSRIRGIRIIKERQAVPSPELQLSHCSPPPFVMLPCRLPAALTGTLLCKVKAQRVRRHCQNTKSNKDTEFHLLNSGAW